MPTPPNFREFSQSSALAARTSKVDSNDRALLKFDMQPVHFLRVLIENIFYTSQPYNLRHALQCSSAAKMHHPQSLAFTASFQTHI
jgi:hypothetical protein